VKQFRRTNNNLWEDFSADNSTAESRETVLQHKRPLPEHLGVGNSAAKIPSNCFDARTTLSARTSASITPLQNRLKLFSDTNDNSCEDFSVDNSTAESRETILLHERHFPRGVQRRRLRRRIA
jgi:hypothetical protein